MNLRELTDAVNTVLLDEELLRLLHYVPKGSGDDPLSSKKQNILSMPSYQKWEIINNHLMTAPNFNDLDDVAISRLVFYAGESKGSNNYLYANQQFHFDIYTHYTIENIDRRMEWICDKLNEILFRKRIGGIGKTVFIRRYPIVASKGYVGYRLIYEFCLEQCGDLNALIQ